MKAKKKKISYPLISPPQQRILSKRPWQLVIIQYVVILLVFIVLSIAVGSVERAQWINPQPSLMTVLLLAIISSLVLAKIRIPSYVSFFIAVVLACLVTLWQASKLLPVLDKVSAFSLLITEIQSSAHTLIIGNPSEGTIHFAIFLIIVVWLAGFFSTWFALKRNCWITVILGTLIILVNLSNLTEQHYLSFFFFLISNALLVVATNLLKHSHNLENYDFGRLSRQLITILFIVFGFSLLMVSTMWLMPEIRTSHLTATITKPVPFKSNINNFLFSFLAKIPSKQPIMSSGLSTTLSLTDPIDISDTEHFLINSRKPFYWRVRVYDKYLSTGWTNSPITTVTSIQSADSSSSVESSTKYNKFGYTVINRIKTDIILTAGKITSIDIPFTFKILEPLSFNINLVSSYMDSFLPADIASMARSLRLARTTEKNFGLNEIQLRLPSNIILKSTGEARHATTEESMQTSSTERRVTEIKVTRKIQGIRDVIAITASSVQGIDQQYSVTSTAYSPAASELAKAGENYPPEVTDYYLQLPSGFPDRVRQLAKSITAEAKNNYEKVMALKQYLAQIPYNREAIHSIPDGTDAVDYFLHNKKTGNCFYFASAGAVMLRSIGIPSRLVVGYLPGDWNAGSGTSVIRAKDFHSWLEVYFPGHGWIEFEVTPDTDNTSGVSFVEGLIDFEDEMFIDENLEFADDYTNVVASPKFDFRYGIAIILVLLIISGLILFYRVKQYLKLDYASRIYSSMTILASIARLSPKSQQTPLEYCQRLAQVIPDGTEAINTIGTYYMERQYGRFKEINTVQREILNKQWHLLSRLLIKKLFIA